MCRHAMKCRKVTPCHRLTSSLRKVVHGYKIKPKSPCDSRVAAIESRQCLCNRIGACV